ncbi:sigma factor [Lactiplantibacillus plajomi]|uniref:Sigma factor n=1 Tax=Lactiplantibacillus plajomi TaxID=1457217 RepID=A0ABV6K1W8_9LACO|nr:sigma factor [Lactiplantibacillus plajomi]
MSTNRLDNQAAFALLAEPAHQRLLYGALKAANVTRCHPQFEDCVTVAHLTWLSAYQNFDQSLPEYLADFEKFAFRKIKWRTIDYLRRQNLRRDHQVNLTAAAAITVDPIAHHDDHLLLHDLLRQLSARCQPGEKIVLTEFFLAAQPVSTIMQRHHVSRRTVYNWRHSLLVKAHRLYQRQR